MKADYCDTTKAHAEIKKQLLEKLDLKITSTFQAINTNRYTKMEEFYELLLKRKNIGGLQNSFKQKFYKTLLEQQIQQFNFIKNLDVFTLKVLKLIKCQLKDFKLDWRNILGKLELSTKSTNKVARLHGFLKHIRIYYDENNSMEVYKHFLGRYNVSDEMIWIYMEYFMNMTKNTKPEIISELLARLTEIYRYEDIKDMCYFRWLVRIKRKLPQVVLTGPYVDDLNHAILNQLILLQIKKGAAPGSLSSRYLTNVFAKFIGKTNPKSVEMINWLFKIFQNGVSAFEDKKLALKILKNFFKPLWMRKMKEDRLRKKLLKKDSDQDDQEDKKDKDKDDGDKDDDMTQILDTLGTLAFDESDDEEEEEEADETVSTEDKQKKRLEQLTQLEADELTPEIMAALKVNLQVILEDIFFTPNKQVSSLLKYIYFLFPQLAEKSIEYLAKGMDITEMNFSIHMKNTKKIVQYLLVFGEKDRLMDNILNIIAEISKIRYVKQAWHVLSYVIMKIPCLDEEDYKKVPEETKANFEKNFKMSHDVFYERYSEMMFELFKKFIKEVQVKEKKTIYVQDNPFLGFAYNVYPEFQKRLIELTVSNYIESQNSFICNYFELVNIPQKHINTFLPELKQNLTEEQVKIKFNEILIASRNIPFSQFSQKIVDLAHYESKQRIVTMTDMMKVYFQENIWTSPIYKPLQSSLEYLWNPEAKYLIQLKNINQQQVEDSVRKVYNIWREAHQNISQFIQNHSKSLEQELDAVQIIKKIYFTVDNPDFEVRKKLMTQLDIIDCIIEHISGGALPWSQSNVLTQVKLKDFPLIFEIKQKTIKMVEDLFHIFYIQQPHQHKIIYKLLTMGLIISLSIFDNGEKWIEEYKDITRVIKANESKNHVNHILILMRQSEKYLYYASVDAEFKEVKKSKIIFLIELAVLHADDGGGIGPVAGAEDYNVTDLLVELLKMTPPAGTEPNRIKLFHQRISKVLSRTFTKSKHIFTTQTLFQLLGLIINHITSSEKSIRQGYLSALKKLLEIIQDVRINQSSLEIISQGLTNTSSKQKLIWATGLIFLEDNITNFGKFYNLLNELLFSDDFLIRKYSQFLLSYIIRSDRKKHSKQNIITNLGEYKQKTLDEFLQTGYLRPEHIDTHIKFKKILMKFRSYNTCVVKQKHVNKQALSFIFDSEKCLKFLKQYQTDQVSSEDELKLKKKSSVTSQLSELSDIFSWLKSRYSKLLDISEHKFTSYEAIFGQRFFKYIFQHDYHFGFPFFNATKDFIQNTCIPNLQTLDNQVVVLNYLSTLIAAYSKFYKTIKSQEVEAFLLRTIGEILEKSSGQFFNFFKKLSLVHVDQLPLIVDLFQKKYSPSHISFYRTIEIRLIWFSHKRSHLIEMIKDVFKARKNLQNFNVANLLKLIITFNENHFFHAEQIKECNILNMEQLVKKNEIIQQTKNIYTATRTEYDNILYQNIQKLINSEKIEDRKSGNDLVNHAVVSFCSLRKTDANLIAMNRLFKLAVDVVINNKQEFSTEDDPLEDTLMYMLCSVYPVERFLIIYQTFLKLLVPIPKVSNYLNQLVRNPYNFLRLSEQNYELFIKKLLSLLQINLNFKQVLTTIASFLYFRKPKEDSSKLCSSPRQLLTYNMAILLCDVRNLNRYEQELQKVLNSKEKEKIKVWATLMINSRGKREILEDEETHSLWRSIKDVSNPYFYHC